MIRYKIIKTTPEGYKYELTDTEVWQLGSKFIRYDVVTEYFSLITGQLMGHSGFRWDGATAAFDRGFMDGSCKHDILCKMFEAGMLPMSLWGAAANEMRITNKFEGMPWIRRQWTWAGVSIWGIIKRWVM